jgi:aminoglycoside-2''-adenylyltransferase
MQAGVDYRLFGGWAVDFHAGWVTRVHDDVDIAVWLADRDRIAELLARDGWTHAPEPDEDGGTGYKRDGVRLELTFLVLEDGAVKIPLRAGRVAWPDAARDELVTLEGVTARVQPLDVLRRTKASPREDEGDATKDRADLATLERL